MRAFGPAEHPIALGAALVMLVPLGDLRRCGPWVRAGTSPLGALVIGVLTTVSRTGVLMLIVIGVVFLWLRPSETRRLWPVLVPLIVATQIAVPGTLGSLEQAFFPEGGLIAEQEGMAGDCSSSGRVADIGPTLEEVGKKPFLGYGFGTRVDDGHRGRTPASSTTSGSARCSTSACSASSRGCCCSPARCCARCGRRAKEDDSPTGWLLVA